MFSLPHDVIKFVSWWKLQSHTLKLFFFLYSLRGEGFVPHESFFGKTFVCNCWYFNIVSCESLSFENLKIGSLDMNVFWDGCLSDVAQKKFPFVNTSLTCSICKYNLYQFFNACGLHFTICCKKSSIRFFSICIWSGRDVRGPFLRKRKKSQRSHHSDMPSLHSERFCALCNSQR